MAALYGREDVVRMLLNSAGVQVDASTTVEVRFYYSKCGNQNVK